MLTVSYSTGEHSVLFRLQFQHAERRLMCIICRQCEPNNEFQGSGPNAWIL